MWTKSAKADRCPSASLAHGLVLVIGTAGVLAIDAVSGAPRQRRETHEFLKVFDGGLPTRTGSISTRTGSTRQTVEGREGRPTACDYVRARRPITPHGGRQPPRGSAAISATSAIDRGELPSPAGCGRFGVSERPLMTHGAARVRIPRAGRQWSLLRRVCRPHPPAR